MENLLDIFNDLNGDESRQLRQDYIIQRSVEFYAPLSGVDCDNLITGVLGYLDGHSLSSIENKQVVDFLNGSEKLTLCGWYRFNNKYLHFFINLKDKKPFLLYVDEHFRRPKHMGVDEILYVGISERIDIA